MSDIGDSNSQHIPLLLQDRLTKLKNVSYKNIIKEFIQEYNSKTYNSINEEYLIIYKYLEKISESLFKDKITLIIKKNMDVSSFQIIIDEEEKERFIHPFQNFLLGTIIIDSFYCKYVKWISRDALNTENEVEKIWFLTSLFHDLGKPYNTILGSDEDNPEVSIRFKNYTKYISFLSSFYEFVKKGNKYQKWNKDVTLRNHSFEKVLNNYYDSNNHGVIGCFLMFKDLEIIYKDESYTPLFMQALWGISIHDKFVYIELLKEKLLPINIEHFPIYCLLLYCDAIQEWNRKVKISERTELSNIVIGTKVNFEVIFQSSEDSVKKLQEIDCINKCISPQNEIEFWFTQQTKVTETQ